MGSLDRTSALVRRPVTNDGEVCRVVVAAEGGPVELDTAGAVLGDRNLRPAV